MKTYYDVLRLEKNCTAQEIKDSFIKLSKEYHPDKNKNVCAHKQFVAVNEAYSILGKKDKRCSYDASLTNNQRMSYEGAANSQRMHYANYYDYMQTINRKRNTTHGNTYFTSRRLNAFFFCCILLFIGAGIQLKNEKRHTYLVNQKMAKTLELSKLRAKKLGKEQAIQNFANGTLKAIPLSDVEEELNETSYKH